MTVSQEKWLCNRLSTLFKCQRFTTFFSSHMHCFPSLPPPSPSSPTSRPLPSSSESQRSFAVVRLVFGKSPTTIWWPEPIQRRWAGSYSQVRTEGTAALFSSSGLEQLQPAVKFHLSFLWVAVKPGGTNQDHCPTTLSAWRWEVRKYQRPT